LGPKDGVLVVFGVSTVPHVQTRPGRRALRGRMTDGTFMRLLFFYALHTCPIYVPRVFGGETYELDFMVDAVGSVGGFAASLVGTAGSTTESAGHGKAAGTRPRLKRLGSCIVGTVRSLILPRSFRLGIPWTAGGGSLSAMLHQLLLGTRYCNLAVEQYESTSDLRNEIEDRVGCDGYAFTRLTCICMPS
jgi:hypothetical protein